MTNDLVNNYIFVHAFQWSSGECYNNVTNNGKNWYDYIHTVPEGLLKLMPDSYFETREHLRWGSFAEHLTALSK